MEDAVVIIPTYNRAEYLSPCLCSVLSQTSGASEVVVVDDGSTDATPHVVAAFGDQVDYVRKPNTGKSASLNLALKRSASPLVWIVDDDDLVCPDALERLAGMLERNSTASFAYGRHTRFADDPDSGRHRDLGTGYWCSCPPERFLTATLEDFFAHQAGMLVRRRLYEKVGPFDESLVRSQDYEMLIRLARAGDCVSTDEVVFHQRQHSGLRGRRGKRFRADDLTRKWIEADQKIFRRLYRQMALQEFLPRGVLLTDERSRRRALIQRGVIMARRKLWKVAAADFAQAASLGCGELDDEESVLLHRAFASKYGCSEVLSSPDPAAALLAMNATPADARALRLGLARGLVWRIREAALAGRFAETALLGAFALRLCIGLPYSRTISSSSDTDSSVQESNRPASSGSSRQNGGLEQ